MRPTRVEIERVYFALVRDELDCFLCVIEFESKRNAFVVVTTTFKEKSHNNGASSSKTWRSKRKEEETKKSAPHRRVLAP